MAISRVGSSTASLSRQGTGIYRLKQPRIRDFRGDPEGFVLAQKAWRESEYTPKEIADAKAAKAARLAKENPPKTFEALKASLPEKATTELGEEMERDARTGGLRGSEADEIPAGATLDPTPSEAGGTTTMNPKMNDDGFPRT
ncbi:MAG: hypothetical protein ABIE84_02575 [bacterium]